MKIQLALMALIVTGSCFTADTWGQRLRRSSDNVKEGDRAPDFQLKSLDGKQTVKLSSYRGKKPVALIFGSYT